MQTIFGFLNINKPPNCTSFDVVRMVRKSLGIKKIGHFGTLDPFATGVLLIGIKEASRLFEYLQSDKTYLAGVTFGIETDTNDITGKVVQNSANIPRVSEISQALNYFIGKVKQRPPVFSAKKICGTRAYELARKNQISPCDLTEKEIEIYSIEIISYYERAYQGMPLLKLKIHCSSGTYIRAVARDLGRKLNTYGTLASLARIKIGNNFLYEHSVHPQLITKATLSQYLISPLSVLDLQKIYLTHKQIIDITCGRVIKLNSTCEKPNGKIKSSLLLDNNNRLLAVGEITNGCMIKPKKVFLAKDEYFN